jgi:thiol-disulfide isomerase/thioredoxin
MIPRRTLAVAAAAIAAAAAAAALGGRHVADKPACPAASRALADKLRPLAEGDLAALAVSPVPAPALGFTDANGAKLTLADFKGRALVLNLWATWCVPCVAELPALATLATLVADDGIAVVPLSSDRGGAGVVAAFFASHGIAGLPVLLDENGAAGRALETRGVPTTIIIDRARRERARLEGAADWASPAAVATIRRLAG